MTASASVARECWCGTTEARRIGEFETSGATLVQCCGCGVFALHPQPRDERLAAAYSREYYGSSRRKFIAPIAALVNLFQGGRVRLVSRRIPGGGSILDIGCGNGGFLLQMQRRGYRVQGTEWTAGAAARVPKESNIPMHVGDLSDLDLPPQSFDAITLWHVLEHLRRPRETLEKIRTLLKDDGTLFMSMPNAESAQANRYGAHWFHHDPPRHLFGFGPRSLTRLLEQTGFHIQRISTWSLEQNPFGEIQSALNARRVARDGLYQQLKGVSRETFATRGADLVRMGILLFPALVCSTLESARGKGATMTIEARPAS